MPAKAEKFEDARIRQTIRAAKAKGMSRAEARAEARAKFADKPGISPEAKALILKLIDLFLNFFFK